MPVAALLAILTALAAVPARSQDKQARVHTAVFSPDQAFWPKLAAPASARPAGAEAGPAESGPGAESVSSAAQAGAGLRIAVLPIRIREKDWQERIPCDSCHRLSANGMEFFLENYLAERLRKRFDEAKGHRVDLVAPHQGLLQAPKVNLLDYQDSLVFPWDKWFDGYGQPLVYRVRDRMTHPGTTRRMDRLGGLLGATHLLFPARVWFKVDTRARTLHSGNLDWGFYLVFWNVAEGRPEWAMAFQETCRGADLDASLEPNLDRALVAAWDRMPTDLQAHWAAEPR